MLTIVSTAAERIANAINAGALQPNPKAIADAFGRDTVSGVDLIFYENGTPLSSSDDLDLIMLSDGSALVKTSLGWIADQAPGHP